MENSGANYQIDLEEQWISAEYEDDNEELCVYTGTVDAEYLTVEWWNATESSWNWIMNITTSSQWTNASISDYLTSSTFTIRFKGSDETGDTIHISQDHVIIVEGIHGINPELVRDIHPQFIYRVYVSALTQLNIDQHNRVPTTDTRLLRRIVRDTTYRGYD